MLKLRPVFLSLTFGTSLSACFQLPTQSVGQVTVLDGSARTVASKQLSEVKTAATIDPLSKTPQMLTASSSGNLSGSSITLQPGSLAIAAELVVEEAVPLGETSLVSELNLDEGVSVQNVGAGLIIRPTEGVDLTQPLTINMPVPVSSGLRLQSTRNVAVFYKQYIGNEMISGVIPGHEITLGADGSASFKGYFGAYWVALVSKPILEEKKSKSEEAIVNTQRVSVIQSTGIVSETAIVAKAVIPEVSWGATFINLDAENRIVSLKATANGQAVLRACKADLFNSVGDNTGIVVDTGSVASMSLTLVRPDAHALVGRFRCQDEQGRQTISSWSDIIQVPAVRVILPIVTWDSNNLAFDAAARTLKLSASTSGNRSLNSCRAEFYPGSTDNKPEIVETGANLSAPLSPSSAEEQSYSARFQCIDEEGRSTVSPWSITIIVPAVVSAAQTAAVATPEPVATSVAIPATTPTASPTTTPIAGPTTTPVADASQQAEIIQWNASSLVFDASTRSITLSAFVNGSPNLEQCQADLFQDPAAASGAVYATGTALSFTHVIASTSAQPLVGRFRCVKSDGEVVTSPWSDLINIPQAPLPNPYCAFDAPSLDLVTAQGTNFPSHYQNFSKTSACVYEMNVFANQAVNMMIARVDRTAGCGLSNHTLAADGSPHAASCAAATASIFADNYMTIARGNYHLIVDFSAGESQPEISLALQPCALADLHMLKYEGNATPSFTDPDSSTGMQHLGGCQFTQVATGFTGQTTHLQFRDLSGAVKCGNGSYFYESGSPTSTSCAATATSFQSMYAMNGAYEIDVQYGISADPTGGDPHKFNLRVNKQVNCPDDFYLLGPTTAGQTPMFNVNKFTRTASSASSCTYDYHWLADAGHATTAYDYRIGNLAGSLNCGVASNSVYQYGNYESRTIDCSNAAVAGSSTIISSGHPYRFSLYVDSTSGVPSSLTVTDVSPVCNDKIYLQNNATAGFYPSGAHMLQELEECLYEYTWTPTSNTPFHLVKDNSSISLCGISATGSQASVNGPGVNITCGNSAAAPVAINPAGFSLNSSYKVQFDYRQTYNGAPPQLRIAATSAVSSCPDDYYLTGSADLGNTANASLNKFQRISACSYEFVYTPQQNLTALNVQHLLADNTSTCGLSNSSPAQDSTYLMDCTGSSPTINNIYLYSGSTYLFSLNQSSSGEKRLSYRTLSPNCSGNLVLSGPAASGLTDSQKAFSPVASSTCLHELVWNPTTEHSFSITNVPSYSYDVQSMCGIKVSSTQPQVDGAARAALCHISDASQLQLISPNVLAGQSYRITLDRRPPRGAPLLKVSRIYMSIPGFGLSWVKGDSYGNSAGNFGSQLSTVVTNVPSARSHSVQWKDATGNLWLFGGLGIDQWGNYGMLSDLWKFEPNLNSWTWIAGSSFRGAAGIYGVRGTTTGVESPGARRSAMSWVHNGKLWLFGGFGKDQDSNEGWLNDLWSYDIADGNWTWVKGSELSNSAGDYTSGLQTSSISSEPRARVGSAAWNGPNGQLYLYAGDSENGYLSDLWVFDTTAGIWTWVDGVNSTNNAMSNTSPGGLAYPSTWSANGELWLYGGSSSSSNFSSTLWRYSLAQNGWVNMGSSPLAGGLGNYGPLRSMVIGSYPSARHMASSWVDASGNFWLFGGEGSNHSNYNSGHLNDMWVYSPSLGKWAWVRGSAGFINASSAYSSLGNFSYTHEIGARRAAIAWFSDGNTYMFGGFGVDSSYNLNPLNDFWSFDTTAP